MKSYATTIAAVFALAVGGGALAQSESLAKAFTANSAENCSQIVWSQETLAKYPRIAVACKEVVQKDGKTFVKFEGEVTRVARRGEEVDVRFNNRSDPLTLTPRPDMEIEMDGRMTPVSRLRPGDQLTFYVPEDRLAASFYTETEPTRAPQVVMIVAPIPQRVAATEDYSDLPRTAGTLPLLGLFSAMLIAIGAGLTAHRWMHRL
jgi:hypothetical protein